jgi:hypothetical protein
VFVCLSCRVFVLWNPPFRADNPSIPIPPTPAPCAFPPDAAGHLDVDEGAGAMKEGVGEPPLSGCVLCAMKHEDDPTSSHCPPGRPKELVQPGSPPSRQEKIKEEKEDEEEDVAQSPMSRFVQACGDMEPSASLSQRKRRRGRKQVDPESGKEQFSAR